MALFLAGWGPLPAAVSVAGAQALQDQPAPQKPAPGPQAPIPAQHQAAVGGRAGDASIPAAGASPRVLRQQELAQIVSQAKQGAPAAAPAAPLPASGTLVPPPVPPASAAAGRAAAWDGTHFAGNPAAPARAAGQPTGALGIPAPGPAAPAQPASPSTFYGSTQVDTYTGCSIFGANEASVAQSSSNPNLVVVAAQMYQNGDGTCGDSHAFAFYSHDGGQHWKQTILPGLLYPVSGDTAVVFDPVRNVFVYSFIEFTRGSPTQGRIGVESSSDGATWGNNTTLDLGTNFTCASGSDVCVDKDMIAVDLGSNSPHRGRVAVTWSEFRSSGLVMFDAISDNGGGSWTLGNVSINFPSSSCGNGSSPAFDANGELMVAWWDCDGSPTLREELSPDGGATWPASSDTTITGISQIGTPSGGCALGGGTAFRCNSFPALAGDPNAADDGVQAFQVIWASLDGGVTDSRFPGVTATVSEIRGLGTTNGGGAWNGGNGFGFNFMSFDNFGDKFFPWIAFAPNGRMDVGFSDREDNASAANPSGTSFDEHGTEADSFNSIHEHSAYVSFTDDGTLASPGSSAFIGDYAGIESEDNNFDTFPVWTDVRGGSNNVRTMDLCYVDCYTFLAPFAPRSGGGSSFTDLYQFNTDPAFGGSGADFWNAVGIREGADGTTVDDDMILYGDRYFSNVVASSNLSPAFNDYLLENDNTGHGARGPYFPQVHSFSSLGGPYTIEWAAGSIVLPAARSDSMGASNVIRVYDAFLATATTYNVGLRPAGGNTSKLSLTLHSGSRGNQQGRNLAAADSGPGTVGQPAFVSYATGSDPAQFDGVVVVNNNGGAGSYTVYLDSALPTGTITIDGGASATNSTAATLTLSASNPTAGDPVLDMRFSSDGVTFGAWQPFASSASFTLASGDGTKTVYVQYRNGAGGISATASHSIILDTVAPVTVASLGGTLACGAYVGQAVVTLTATDGGSGVASTVYQLDGGAVTTYSAPFTVATVGAHTVTFHSTDRAGNVEATKSVSFTVAAAIGGRCFRLTSAPVGPVALAWADGGAQASYDVLRISQSGAVLLPPGGLPATATSFSDTASLTDPFYCYQTLALTSTSTILGRSDEECLMPAIHSATNAPLNFTLELDQSSTAHLTWAPGGGSPAAYLLLAFANGGSRSTVLPATATSATDNTGGAITLYALVAVTGTGATVGNTDVLIAVPGQATVAPASLQQAAAQAAKALEQLQRSGAASAVSGHLPRPTSGTAPGR